MTSKTDEEEIVKNSKNILGEKGASEGLTDLISKINELHKTGGMETLFELISLLHAMRSAASDKLVERTLQAAGRTTDVLTDEKTLVSRRRREGLYTLRINERRRKPSWIFILVEALGKT